MHVWLCKIPDIYSLIYKFPGYNETIYEKQFQKTWQCGIMKYGSMWSL